MMTTENNKTIYESPDGGHTVYARKFGETERTLIKQDENSGYTSNAHRAIKWSNILVEANDNKPLKDLLDQAETLYELTRKR